MTTRVFFLVTTCLVAWSGAQTFTNVTTASGINVPAVSWQFRGAAWADFNGDGFVDLFAPGGDLNPTRLWINNGNGTFTSSIVAAASAINRQEHSCAVADFDNDGDQDVFVCQGNRLVAPAQWIPNRLFVNSGNGTFTEQAAMRGLAFAGTSQCATWGDYDRDGHLDLYLGVYGAPPAIAANILYRNNGNGTFTDVTTATGTASPGNTLCVMFGDYDNDLWPDLWVVNDLGETTTSGVPTALLRNNRNGTFTNVAASVNAAAPIDGMGITMADLENDGDWDAYVSNVPTGPALFLWQGSTSNFLLPGGSYYATGILHGLQSNEVGWSAFFFDYDNDGRNDLFQVNSNGFNRLYRGTTGTPLFVDDTIARGIFSATPNAYGGTQVDYDNDGDLDLYIPAGLVTGAVLARNPGNANNWLKLKLQGVVSNRDALGATVIVRTPGNTQRRQVMSGEGFLCDGDRRLHFGLGANTSAMEVEIRWPTGSVQYLSNVPSNQILTVTEPTFGFIGSMDPNSVNVISMSFPADVSLSYFGAMAVNAAGELFLADRRALRVFPNDPAIQLTTTLGNPYLGNFAGVVSGTGTANMIFSIPNIPFLTGLGAFFVAVTLSPVYPSGIKSILGPQPFTIQ